jgi:hypothetical protein
MRRLVLMVGLVAGLAAQTLQKDMQKISDEFAKLPPAEQLAQQFDDPQRAQLLIELIRMNTRIAEESEVQARYAKGKERRRFQRAQKAAERAEHNCIRALGAPNVHEHAN